eukprot:13734892-Ditylum_brightwellii.AAC.1
MNGDVWDVETVDGDKETNVNLLLQAIELENAAIMMIYDILMRLFLTQIKPVVVGAKAAMTWRWDGNTVNPELCVLDISPGLVLLGAQSNQSDTK